MSSFATTRAARDLPAVDERLISPGSCYEIYDGVLVHAAPADELRGMRRSKILALVEAHTGPEFDVAYRMLTRTSETSDVAPDVSVFPHARDPDTGGRQLERLVFEVVRTESLSHAARKAAKLVARGVHRVFAIDGARACALEWSASLGSWSKLDASGPIEDPALALPLPIEALLVATSPDEGLARALVIQRNPAIEGARARYRAEGRREGLTDLVFEVLAGRDVALDSFDRARILGERDPERLLRWITRAGTCTDVAEVFAEA
jgi:hypothetical protein